MKKMKKAGWFQSLIPANHQRLSRQQNGINIGNFKKRVKNVKPKFDGRIIAFIAVMHLNGRVRNGTTIDLTYFKNFRKYIVNKRYADKIIVINKQVGESNGIVWDYKASFW
jgi:hypothetical protein